jgi:hypothetical protein
VTHPERGTEAWLYDLFKRVDARDLDAVSTADLRAVAQSAADRGLASVALAAGIELGRRLERDRTAPSRVPYVPPAR